MDTETWQWLVLGGLALIVVALGKISDQLSSILDENLNILSVLERKGTDKYDYDSHD